MKGIGLKIYCSECNRGLAFSDVEDNYVFMCKHIFHSECLKEKKCKFCLKTDTLKSIFSFGT